MIIRKRIVFFQVMNLISLFFFFFFFFSSSIGDIAYAVGYANRWEQFFHEISPIATQVPYMVSIGNHEYDWKGQPFKPYWGNYGDDSHGECGIPYSNRFHMPGPGQQSLWYSYVQSIRVSRFFWFF
jgi:hypothetical protein